MFCVSGSLQAMATLGKVSRANVRALAGEPTGWPRCVTGSWESCVCGGVSYKILGAPLGLKGSRGSGSAQTHVLSDIFSSTYQAVPVFQLIGAEHLFEYQ